MRATPQAPESGGAELRLPEVRLDPDAVRAAVAWAEARYAACDVCAERCGVDRHASPGGRCGLGADARIYKEYLHLGEERLLVPSHAVYLSGCSFRCAFCSDDAAVRRPLEVGVAMSPEALAQRIARRRAEGARNVNFVGGVPDVNLLHILRTLLHVPADTHVVWNTNLWTTDAVIELLRPLIGTWLVDWKFGSDVCARKLAGARGYVDGLQGSLTRLREAAGPLPPRVDGDPRPFVMLRHLLMPGHLTCCTAPVLATLAQRWPDVPVNVMTGYFPYRMGRAAGPMSGRVPSAEVNAAVALLGDLPFAHPLLDGRPLR
jgi:putative pyruvate formate lyase activating enzyme